MSVFLGLVLGFGVSPRPQLECFEPLPFPLPSADAEAPRDATAPDLEDLEGPDPTEELAVDWIDAEDPRATAEAVSHESFDWPEPEPAFEPAEADALSVHDGTPEATEVPTAAGEADERWLRDHGSD